MKSKFLVVGVLVALVQFAAVGIASQSGYASNPNDVTDNERVPAADRAFTRKAAEVGLVEVKMGELAEEIGISPAVKDFGKHAVEDYTKINDELKADATKEHIELPTEMRDGGRGVYDTELEMNDRDSGIYDNLMALGAADFDRAYVRAIVADCARDVSEFDKEAKDGRNATIKDFAANAAPNLQEDLKMARDLQSTILQTNGKRTTKSGNPS